ncbi:AbrB/MazE/SpoVT family DNA-binding domain-containing protein [Rubrobacter aplysinae]|uniref:AbrB/MazE/SpoVT family DNA-binding domain-containing protein n=1 Tax=Rubrobacter aplysinae TaxID=909625 RepID=UPI00064BD64B|nr:AbrB/MazE/SpoVT family DNA-binding domain-containing protein [Rubrobacter aplysinae]
MDEIKTTIGRGGRLNIPAEHRRSLGLSEGDEVLVGLESGAITIQSREAAIDRVQRMVREKVGEGRNLSGELITERREEERRESAAETGKTDNG